MAAPRGTRLTFARAARLIAVAGTLVVLVLLSIQATVGAGGDWLYVAPTGLDSQPGTRDQPLRTITRAASLATPGTTISVAPGLYTEPVVTTTNGTAVARIRFVSATRWGAHVRTHGVYRAWFNLGDYVDIVGFDVSAPDAHLGIQNDASHVRTLHNHVHDIATHVDDIHCDENGGSGINDGNYAAMDNEMNANVVHDIGNYRNPAVPTSCWGVHGLYQSTPNSRVLNNIAYRNEAFGITLWHAATRNVVSANLSFNNGVGGIGVGAGDAPGGIVADHYLVSDNIVVDNPLFGIRASGALGSDNRYVSNLFHNNGSIYTQVSGGIAEAIIADPRFINYQKDGLAAGGDYHLRQDSPAIAAGSGLGVPPTDFDGVSRPLAGFDIGPYTTH